MGRVGKVRLTTEAELCERGEVYFWLIVNSACQLS